MRIKSVLCIASVIACVASGASAQTVWDGFHATASVGSLSVKDKGYYGTFQTLRPEGTTVSLGADYRRTFGDRLVIGIETSVAISNAKDHDTDVCTVATCDYDEIIDSDHGTRGSVSLGASVGDSFGPVLVSLIAGVQVSDFYRQSRYSGSTLGDDFESYNSGYRAGHYLGARLEYAISEPWSARFEYRRSELTDSKNSNTYMNISDSSSFDEQFSLGISRRF